MLFNSAVFLFGFLPITWAGYMLLVQHKSTLSIWWLVFASIIFYSAWDIAFLPIFLTSVIFNFLFAEAIKRAGRFSHLLLVFGIAANLGALSYFKYANFFVAQTSELLRLDINWQTVALPLGISFFTFQQIAYLVDVYQGKTSESNFGRYALFNSFFPHLIAGPITHHKEMMDQFSKRVRPRMLDVASGLTLFIMGLIKKMVIADTFAIYANTVFNAAANGTTAVSFSEAWLGAISYALQIYFDFSAYSDMAVGLAKMFGINFPINFASPYKATSIADFWKRWHISLSRFLKEYLYIPLGGNRVGLSRLRFNLLATMALGGIWHGAGWTFLVWGTLHGIYLLINHTWTASDARKRCAAIAGWPIFAWSLTMMAVLFAWIPFRAPDMAVTTTMWIKMLTPTDFSVSIFSEDAIRLLILFSITVIFAPNAYQILASTGVGLPSKGYPATYIAAKPRPLWLFSTFHALVMGLATCVVVLKLFDISEFIYFQF